MDTGDAFLHAIDMGATRALKGGEERQKVGYPHRWPYVACAAY